MMQSITNKLALGCCNFKKHGCITTNQQTGRKYKSLRRLPRQKWKRNVAYAIRK